MALTASALQALTQDTDTDAWRVVGHSVKLPANRCRRQHLSEVVKRDREIGALDLFLSSSGWDLWQSLRRRRGAHLDRFVRWWAEPFSAKGGADSRWPFLR